MSARRIESPLINAATKHLAGLKKDNIVGFVGRVDSFTDFGRYLHTVDFLVGPRASFTSDDPLVLDEFRQKLKLEGYNPLLYSSPTFKNEDGSLKLGSWRYEEEIDGSQRQTEVTTLTIGNKRLLHRLEAAGVPMVTEKPKQEDKPIRLVTIRPYLNRRLAALVYNYESGYLNGTVQPSGEFYKLRETVSTDQVQAMLKGEFPFPIIVPVKNPEELPPTTAERATQVKMASTLDTALNMARRFAEVNQPDWE